MQKNDSTKLQMKNPSPHLKRSLALFTVVWTIVIGMIVSWDYGERQNRISLEMNLHARESTKDDHSDQFLSREQKVSSPTAMKETLPHAIRGVFLRYAIIWLVGLCGISWTLRHINKRIRLREKLEQSVYENEFNLRQMLNAIGDGLVTINLAGNITGLNPVAENLIGRLASDVVGSPFADIFDLTISDTSGAVRTDVSEKDGPYSRTKARLKDAKGSEHTIYCDLTTIKDAEANPVGTVLIFRDATKESKMQQELLKANKLESVAILAGGMAHDFNNLFTGLFGNIQLAMMTLNKDHPSYASLLKANQAFEKGKDLTSRLLTFTSGGIPLLEETALEPVLLKSTQLFEHDNLAIELELPDNLWSVLGDPHQLTQVFINLVSNAVEAMTSGGTVKISAENFRGIVPEYTSGSGDYVMIQIRDNGGGIAPADQDKAFDIFFSTKEQGRGLGLSIVHRIITKHDGFIKLDSEKDTGTTFTLYLPAVVGSAVAPTLPLAATMENKAGAGLSILVVDDDELIRAFSKELLESSGYQVDTTASGEEAIEKYFSSRDKDQPYAAVIMDLSMPGGMSGDMACRELLSHDPAAKIIAVSGYFNDATMAEFSSAGFKGRIAKPFNTETLIKELSRVIALG